MGDEDKENKKKRKQTTEAEEETAAPKKVQRKPLKEGEYDPFDFDQQDGAAQAPIKRTKKTPTPPADEAPVALSEEKLTIFRKNLNVVMSSAHAQSMPLADIVTRLENDHPDTTFTTAEVNAACDQMTEDNQIMVSDGQVFLI